MKDLLNDRQLQTLRRMLDEGPNGFAGDMSAKKYLSIIGAAEAYIIRSSCSRLAP
ncbi:MAG: hypothetical protein KF722_05580 [Nitrospira sp.]|nr:hypothetical protein [Nitrospira sp.]